MKKYAIWLTLAIVFIAVSLVFLWLYIKERKKLNTVAKNALKTGLNQYQSSGINPAAQNLIENTVVETSTPSTTSKSSGGSLKPETVEPTIIYFGSASDEYLKEAM